MRVVIGGGTGFIGKTLIRKLEQRGHDVTTISRRSGHKVLTWTDVERHGLPDGCDAVVNLAGENVMNPLRRWGESVQAVLESSRIGTNRILVAAMTAASSRPRVFVSSSASGYYQASETARYTEEALPGSDYMAGLCQRWEQSAQVPDDIRHAIIRIGLVLGRDGGMMKKIYFPFYMGAGGRIGSGKQWFPWIHVEDATSIFVHALENKDMSGAYNAVAPGICTNQTFTNELASAMWRPAIFPVPGFLLRLTLGEDRASIMLSGANVVPQRTLGSGYKFLHPDLKSAIADCVK